MSGGTSCKCAERVAPLGSRKWRVVDRKCNYSHFNGRRYTPSDYSAIECLVCRAYWRTKASFVDRLPDSAAP